MIREDRELLAELARLNREMASLCMRIMDGSAGFAEQREYARRLVAAGERLGRRGGEKAGVVIEGEVVVGELPAFPGHAVEPHRTHE